MPKKVWSHVQVAPDRTHRRISGMEAGCLVQGTGAVQGAAQVFVSVSAWVALLLCS